MTNKNLHITVASVSEVEEGNPTLLVNDLRLTKAAVLYADQVKLCSLGAWWVTNYSNINNSELSFKQKFELVLSFKTMFDNLNSGVVDFTELQKFHRMLKKNPILLTRREKFLISNFAEQFPEVLDKLSTEFLNISNTMGFDEIKILKDKGLLELQPFTSSHPFSKTTAEIMPEYVSYVENVLNSGDSHPLFDEITTDAVAEQILKGNLKIAPSSARKGKHTGLMADLFDRLPVFDIPVNELLDVREELRKPLIRFRAEMVSLGDEIETAFWDKDFPNDVQLTYQSKIEPAILEIEEKLQTTTFRDFWSRRLVDKYSFVAGGIGGYVLGASVSPLVGIIAAITAAWLFSEASFSELIEKRNDIERNGLFFYYKMKKLK